MRGSTSMMYQRNMTSITGTQSLFMKAAEQLLTGKKVIIRLTSAGGIAGSDVVTVTG